MTSCMSMSHTLGELDGVFVVFGNSLIRIRSNTFDPTCILTVWNFDTNNNISSNVVGWGMLCHLNFNFSITRFRGLQ